MKAALQQIVYLSRATMHVDRAQLADITAVSAENNARVGITGALMFCDGYFLQILEGPADAIAATLDRIALDERHADLQVLARRDDVTRSFGEWSMACLHEGAMTPEQSRRAETCIAMIADPTLVDRIGNDAHQLLVDLRTAIAADEHGRAAA